MSHKGIILLTVILLPSALSAQKVRTVSGESVYYPPENVSIEQAKQIAVERARIDAIAREFGTNVSQMNTVAIATVDGTSETNFNAFGSTEVKGDWLADTKQPEIHIDYDNGMLVVTAKVWGKVRERNTADLQISAKILCNGTESEKFLDNDRFSVKVRTPVNGFISIYLIDDNVQQAYCLLPYENEDGTARKIQRQNEYTLISPEDSLYPYREATILTTEKSVDFNRVVFIFSPICFSMPLTEQGEFVPELSVSDFDKWLQRNRIKDENMYVIQKMIEIRK